MRWTWFVALVVACSVLSAPASAQEVEPAEARELYEAAMVTLLDEVGLLVALDRFDAPVPDAFAGLPDSLGILEHSEQRLQQALDQADGVDGPAALNTLRQAGLATGHALDDALSGGSREGPVDPRLHVVAYDDLLRHWWLAGGAAIGLAATPLPAWEPAWDPDTAALWVAPDPDLGFAEAESLVDDVVDPAPREVASGSDEPSEPPQGEPPIVAATAPESSAAGSGDALQIPSNASAEEPPDGSPVEPAPSASPAPWLVVTAAIAAGAVLVAGTVWFRRNRRWPAESPDPADVLEAGRRLLRAGSVDELGESVVEHSTRLSGATGALFICDEGRWSRGAASVPAADLVDQARSTGRTVSTDGDSIVPVVAEGAVVGVIMVAEVADGVTAVEQLAPLAGEGLVKVMHQSAAEELAFIDGLTSINNRRRFDLDLTQRSQEAAADQSAVAVAMIDVDHFKHYNDTNGHAAGDEALRTVAALIAENVRVEDTVYRYGGEEFAVLLPGAGLEMAKSVVERIRAAIEAHAFAGGPAQPGGRVTVSVGVAAAPPPDGGVMLHAADQALYRAKEQGRNRVVATTAG